MKLFALSAVLFGILVLDIGLNKYSNDDCISQINHPSDVTLDIFKERVEWADKPFIYTASLIFIIICIFQNSRLFNSSSIVILLAINNIRVTSGDGCDCKEPMHAFIVTRLWDIVPPSTAEEVITLGEALAPIVTALPGFIEYGSAVVNEDAALILFWNVFETIPEAEAAQQAARDFVAGGELNGKITPHTFTDGYVDFHFSSEQCLRKSIKGKFLSTRLWKLTDGATFDAQGVVKFASESEFPSIITSATGFREYGGAVLLGSSNIFFYSVFDTEKQAEDSSIALAKFISDSVMATEIEKVIFTGGVIGYHYSCVETDGDNDDGEDD